MANFNSHITKAISQFALIDARAHADEKDDAAAFLRHEEISNAYACGGSKCIAYEIRLENGLRGGEVARVH